MDSYNHRGIISIKFQSLLTISSSHINLPEAAKICELLLSTNSAKTHIDRCKTIQSDNSKIFAADVQSMCSRCLMQTSIRV